MHVGFKDSPKARSLADVAIEDRSMSSLAELIHDVASGRLRATMVGHAWLIAPQAAIYIPAPAEEIGIAASLQPTAGYIGAVAQTACRSSRPVTLL